jgi:hypothetical protein
MILYYILGIVWAVLGFISWIYAYNERQFLEYREFAVIPLYIMSGALSFLCIILYWLISHRTRHFVSNPFRNFKIGNDNTYD